MPNQRSTNKHCLAAWIDYKLVEAWKQRCLELGQTQTERLIFLIGRDLDRTETKKTDTPENQEHGSSN
jgi:hypothetical protein